MNRCFVCQQAAPNDKDAFLKWLGKAKWMGISKTWFMLCRKCYRERSK